MALHEAFAGVVARGLLNSFLSLVSLLRVAAAIRLPSERLRRENKPLFSAPSALITSRLSAHTHAFIKAFLKVVRQESIKNRIDGRIRVAKTS